MTCYGNRKECAVARSEVHQGPRGRVTRKVSWYVFKGFMGHEKAFAHYSSVNGKPLRFAK